MALHYKTAGFIFKREDRLDADRVFSVFTKDFGRIEIFGKAIRRITSKLRSNADLFSFSEIEFIQGKNKKTLTDAFFLEKFKSLPRDPEKLEVSYRVSNLLDSFIKGEEKDERILELLLDFFHKLYNQKLSTNHLQLLYFYFFWNFISLLGYAPELFTCAVCKKSLSPINLYLSNKEGGVICENCSVEGKAKIQADTVKVLRLILKKDWETLSKLKVSNFLAELKEVSDNYNNYLLTISQR